MNTPEKKPPRALVILVAVVGAIMAIPGGIAVSLLIISFILKM